MRHNGTLFDEKKPLSGSDSLSVRVGENVSDETRKVLLNFGGTDALYGLLRYGTIDDFVTNDKLIWGHVKAAALKETLGTYIGVSSSAGSCKSFL